MLTYASVDLTGKARIRHASMHLFARRGVSRTSLRLVANRAKVSIALIGHHYGNKQALSDALDAFVLRCLSEATSAVTSPSVIRAPLPETCGLLVSALLRALLAEPDMGHYLRRRLLDSSDLPRGSQLLNQLGTHIEQLLAPLITMPANEAPNSARWWTQQVLMLAIGPALMRPLQLETSPNDNGSTVVTRDFEAAPFGLLFSALPITEMKARSAA